MGRPTMTDPLRVANVPAGPGAAEPCSTHTSETWPAPGAGSLANRSRPRVPRILRLALALSARAAPTTWAWMVRGPGAAALPSASTIPTARTAAEHAPTNATDGLTANGHQRRRA